VQILAPGGVVRALGVTCWLVGARDARLRGAVTTPRPGAPGRAFRALGDRSPDRPSRRGPGIPNVRREREGREWPSILETRRRRAGVGAGAGER
jgi:hypothetical protein